MEQKTLGKWQLLVGIVAVIIGTFLLIIHYLANVEAFLDLEGISILILGIAMILTGYYNLKIKRKR